jgi:signal transduction histidine kinase
MRLLNKTIRSYFTYSFVIVLVAIPLFYFIIRILIDRDVDRDLIAQKDDIVRKLDRAVLFDPFDLLGAFAPDVDLTPSQEIRQYNRLYTIKLVDKTTHSVTPYRVLSSNVIIRGQYYNIVLKSSLINNRDLIKSIVFVQALLLVLIGLGLALINRGLSKQIWGPFYNTLNRLRQFKVEQQKPIDLPQSDIAEFNDLNQTIKDLTERTRQAYLSQKEFTENASHEMQTPLAVIQTKLELLMQTQPLSAEQAGLIASLNDANSRLARLNKSLLLLTKIENNQFPEIEDVEVGEICNKIMEQLSHQAEIKNIKVAYHQEQNLVIKASRALIEILINNILTNAIRYNVPDGSVRITINDNQLIVQNTGAAPIQDKERVFERFQKEGNHSQSIGLGLAIAKKICNLYHYQIAYNFQDQQHTFTIHFLT